MTTTAKMRFSAATVAAALSLLIVPAFYATTAKAGTERDLPVSRFQKPTWPLGHLYVLDIHYHTVDRFPLGFDGLPIAHMDGMLNLQNAQEPEGLAVDTRGQIFVSDVTGWGGGAVAKFPAGATGDRNPTSLLHLSGCQPNYLKVDSAGRLYVDCLESKNILIFRNAAKGYDSPLSTVPEFRPGTISDYFVSRSGALYVLVYAFEIGVYDSPLQNPVEPNGFLAPQGGFEFTFNQTMAYDEPNDRVFIEFEPRYGGPWYNVDFAARSLDDSGAMDHWILTDQCGNQSFNDVGGSVVVQKYLIVSCNSNGDILVYRTDAYGMQRSVETVVKDIYPWEIAVGP